LDVQIRHAGIKARASGKEKREEKSRLADYRVAIAKDCECQCVFCDCHEDSVGGSEAMEMD
jgi:hypothetical protein